jgi:MFS family permease
MRKPHPIVTNLEKEKRWQKRFRVTNVCRLASTRMQAKVDAQQRATQKSILINLSFFQFLSFVRRGIFYTFMINYLFDLMKTATSTTLLGTLNMAASALGQNLLWGKIADRYRLRTKLIIAGESIAATTYLIVFLIHRSLLGMGANFTAGLSLIFGLSFLEFFWSMSDVGWAALLTDVTTTKTRGGIVGTLNFIASLGRMIGINFAGFLYNDGEGFRQGTIFYIVIIMLVVSATIMWIASRYEKKTNAKTEKIMIQNPQQKNGASSNHKEIYKWFLTSLIIIVMGAACINQIFLIFLGPDVLNMTSEQMASILTAWTLGGMLTSLLSGWLADRIGRATVLIIGLILAAITPLFYGSASNVLTMALIYGINGVAFWTIQTIGFAFAGDIIPEEQRGRLLSRYNTVMALSWGPAGFLIGGPVADLQTNIFGLTRFTAFVNTFYLSSILVALGTILFAIKVGRKRARSA